MQAKNSTFALLYVIIMLSIFFIGSLTHAATAPKAAMVSSSTANHTQQTFSLKQISGINGILLRGTSSAKIFYLPVIRQWKIKKIDLHLFAYHVTFNNLPNTVTLFMNDTPLSTMQFSGILNQRMPWDLSMNGDMINGNVINLKFTSFTPDIGYSCYNLTNPNFWIFFSGDSTVTYTYEALNYHPDLSLFPFPFITDPSLEPDHVILTYPDKPTLDDYTALFYVANTLNHYATWRGIKIDTLPISQLTQEQKTNHHLIYIGTSSSLPLATFGTQLPLHVENGRLTSKPTPIPDTTGVIMLTTSPWNPHHAIMFITGNTPEAVSKASLGLRDPNFSMSVLFNEYALITQPQAVHIGNEMWSRATLKDLGYENQTIYGNGENVIAYDIELPTDKTVNQLDLSLNYSTSPFLATLQNSYLTVRMNSVPVDGITLNTKSNKISTFKLQIKKELLHPGKNHLEFVFNLRLQNSKCTPQDYSLAWATIFSNSLINLTFGTEAPHLVLNMFNTSTNNVIVALANNSYTASDSFIDSIARLGQRLAYGTSIRFMSASQLDMKNGQDGNILYIGALSENSVLTNNKNTLPFYFADDQIHIKADIIKYLAISHETPIGITEIAASPFNHSKLLTVITGTNDDGMRLGLDLLINPKKEAFITGDAVLIYPNGSFTSVHSSALGQLGKNKIVFTNSSQYIYFAITMIIVIVILFLLGKWVFGTLRDYFSRNSKN